MGRSLDFSEQDFILETVVREMKFVVDVVVILCYYLFLQKNILLLLYFIYSFFFSPKFVFIFSCSGMFRYVPECSGMFRNVPCSGFYRRPSPIALIARVDEELAHNFNKPTPWVNILFIVTS